MHYIFENCEYSEPLIERIYQLNIQATSFGHDIVDVDLVKKAVAFAKYWHNGQTRKSGELYYSHPIAVAGMAMEEEFTENIICGALLHDVLEDTACTYEIICQEFTHRIAEIVYRLTRVRNGVKISTAQIVQEAFQFMDLEALKVKLFDRVHNIQTIQFMPDDKQKKVIAETTKEITMIAAYLQSITAEMELKKICASQNDEAQSESSTFLHTVYRLIY